MARRRRRHEDEGPEQRVWADWMDADDAGDTARAVAAAERMLALEPDSSIVWFQAGLLSKALGRWDEAVTRNARAVELFTAADAAAFEGDNPAAWNLGIAATALGDWPVARRAWQAYGIEGIADGDGPVDVDLGLAPVRVNPDEPSLPHQRLPRHGTPEVLWCWRRSPAHAVVASVPLPGSGHRFHDVLLHDGAPRGTRMLDGREVAVFDELARLEDSGVPTWQAHVVGAGPDEMGALTDLLGPRDLAVDDWSGLRMLCASCSHGSPDAAHHHEPPAQDATRLGLAGAETELRDALDEWLDAHRQVAMVDLELVW